MKVLYIYPHPDDESFGPAPAIAKQRREGHEVHLLTLTKGGATKQRHKYNYTIEEMGEVRHEEMRQVAWVLDLNGMTVLDLPDGGLKEMDPRDIERVIEQEIERVQPNVVVTYPVHGISGFHDHLVSHAVVKRVYLEMQKEHGYLKRLAFHTMTEAHAAQSPHFKLNFSKAAEIDCLVEGEEVDFETANKALDCYETYKETIDKTGIRDLMKGALPYEFYGEAHDPPLADLFGGLE